MSSDRINPAAGLDDLDEFKPRPAGQRRDVSPAAIDQIAARENFPSRSPAPASSTQTFAAVTAPAAPAELTQQVRRRRVTGRNQQLNIKATSEAIQHFYELANELDVPLGEMFRLALEAFDRQRSSQN